MGIETRTLTASDGRTLRLHDAGTRGQGPSLPVFWHHGTPGIGEPPAPLLALADELGMRLLGLDRPGYGGSERLPGRRIGEIADDVADAADALGFDRYGVLGYSGGGPHALACAASDPRVVAVVSVAGMAPRAADGLDWYDGMIASGRRVLGAAEQGEQQRRAAEDEGYDPEFLFPDLAALDGPWEWLGRIASACGPDDLDGAVDDDLAYVHEWGVEPTAIEAPVLLIHGEADRIVPVGHAHWLDSALREAEVDVELRVIDGAGHISVLGLADEGLRWIARVAARG
ncbi:alpha/beta hydrolase family protein [Demequina sp.]|uniref:alpha/beta hydrolase family protein n=1 Tax=Demequina sp. TaxID=2050685 RepID=UPI003A87EE8E